MIALVLAAGLFAWTVRAERAWRAEAARRTRLMRAAGESLGNLAQGMVLALDVIDGDRLKPSHREALEDARAGLFAFGSSLRAAQCMAQTEELPVLGGLEGWVRVAAASVRAEGVFIRVAGTSTKLRVAGERQDVWRLLEDVMVGLGATKPPKSMVEVMLDEGGVDISAQFADGAELDARVPKALERADRVGLSGRWTPTADGVRVMLRVGKLAAPKSDIIMPAGMLDS